MLAAIVAMAENRVIGRAGRLPWHLPDELAHFKRVTLGRVCVMGRATFDSIGFPLKGRTNLVLTRDRSWHRDGVVVAHDVEHAVTLAGELAERDAPGSNTDPDRCPIVLGGARVYEQTLGRVDRLELTIVAATVDGDAFFPKLDPNEWVEVRASERSADDRHRFGYRCVSLDRRSAADRSQGVSEAAAS